MSKEIEKSNSGVPSTSTGRKIVSTGMMAGLQVSLGQVELPRMFNQLVLFVLDGSGSMSGIGISGRSKGHEVHSCVVNVLERLQQSKNKTSFDVGFFAYAEDSVEMFSIRSVTKYELIKDCFNPCEFIIKYEKTELLLSLTTAKDLALDYLEKYKDSNTSVLIIILGDGAINDYDESYQLKEELNQHEKISFSSILLETPQWEEKFSKALINEIRNGFKNLASEGADYLSTIDPDEIRKHMIKSITKVSQL